MKVRIEGVLREGGRLEVDRTLLSRLLTRFAIGVPRDGLRVTVTIAEDRGPRPSWLNRFYWGFIIGPTAEHCGYTKDEMHEAWKLEFLKVEDPDRPLPTVRSTADLSEAEMKAFIQDIRIAAASMWGFQLPEINENLEA